MERLSLKSNISITDLETLKEDWDGIYCHTEEAIIDGSQKLMIKVSNAAICHVQSVPPVFDSLTCDASFILDVGHSVFHWSSERCNRICKAEGLNIAAN